MGQSGDALSAINQLIRHGTFDGSAFYALLKKVLGLASRFRFRALV